jgi:hypothetical protein
VLTAVIGLGSAPGYALHDFLMVRVVRPVTVLTALTWSMGIGVAVLPLLEIPEIGAQQAVDVGLSEERCGSGHPSG